MKRKLMISAAALAFVSAFAWTPSFAQVTVDQNANTGAADSGLSDAMKADPDNYITGMYVIDKKSGTVYLMMPGQAPSSAENDEPKSDDESDQSTSPPVPPTSKSGLTHWLETPILLA